MRLRRLRLPILLAAALAVWLLWPPDDPVREDLAGRDAAVEEAAPPLLVEPGAARAGPALAGAAHRSAPRPSREGLPDSEVQVLTAEGDPRVGIPVRVHDPLDEREAAWVLTDGKGKVHLRGVPHDGSVRVEVFAGWVPAQRGGGTLARTPLATVAITAPAHKLTCPTGLLLRVVCEDAESGRRVRAPWRPARKQAARPQPEPSLLPAQVSPVLPGARRTAGIVVDGAALRDHVAWDPSMWNRSISRYATALEMVYPLRRQARVHVRALEHDGRVAERMQVSGFKIAGRCGSGNLRTTPDHGGVLVHGIPFFRLRPVDVLVTRPPAEGQEPSESPSSIDVEGAVIEIELERDGVSGEFSFADYFPDAAIGTGRLPREPERLLLITARFPEDPTTGVEWGEDGDAIFGISSGSRFVRAGPRGRVEATVLCADGAPAVGALVTCAGRRRRTDVAGRVRFDQIEPGEQILLLAEPGLVRTKRVLTVQAKRTTRIEMREASGGTIHVRVVDAEGKALPYAALGRDGRARWVDLRRGIQRLDPYTDVHGRRTLRRFPAGTWTIRASWADLEGHAKATVVDAKAVSVTIVLEPAPTDRVAVKPDGN